MNVRIPCPLLRCPRGISRHAKQPFGYSICSRRKSMYRSVPRVHGPVNGLAATAVESRTCERFLVSENAASWIARITIRFEICLSPCMPGSYFLFLATTANVNNCSYHSYAIALWSVMERGLMPVKKKIGFTIGTNRCPISLVRSDERQAADIGQWFHQIIIRTDVVYM